MNTLAIAQELSTLPEGVLMENRRMRITSQLGLAAGLAVPLPGSELPPGELRNYYNANAEAVCTVLYQINEAIGFNPDRALELGYRVWEQRHSQAYTPKATDIFAGYNLRDLLPEFELVQVGIEDVDRGLALIREGLAV